MKKHHWNCAGKALEILAEKVFEHSGGPVGIDFLSSPQSRYSQHYNVDMVMREFRNHRLTRLKLLIATKIDELMGYQIEELKVQNRNGHPTKDLNVIILTNGSFYRIPSQGKELEKVLIGRVRMMNDLAWLRQTQIGLQFVQLDSTPDSQAAFQQLDDDLHEKHKLNRYVLI